MVEPVLQGQISRFRLPDVLGFLNATRQTGTLHVAHEEREASLFFRQGALVYAFSNQDHFRLGSVLLRKKRITPEQRDRIDLLMRGGGGQFGALAVRENFLADAELRDFLKVQVSEIVFDASVWSAGSFSFAPETELPSHAVTIAIDLPNLIMEGARRIDEWEQCVKLLPDRSLVFRVVAAPRDEKITLTADEWKILFLINGQRTLDELCRDADDEPFHVYRVLYGLQANKLIEPVRGVVHDDGTDRAEIAEVSGDATIRQVTPQFGSESTMRDEEPGDDTSLLVSSEAHLSYADVVRPTVAQLRLEAEGRVIPLTEAEYLLGRHRDNGIQVTDLGVSGFHARIYRGAEGYILEDLKSRNGSWVNGARVFHTTLMTGDLIHIGQTDLLYEVLL
jgi:hypothetical protein